MDSSTSRWVVPQGPRRIVCLTEEPTEILYTLGEGERVVGISAYTVRPPEARRDKPVVSAFVGGRVDRIVDLQPDLVIGFSDIQADLARELIAANQSVLIFNQRSVQQILEVIVDLGSLVGRRRDAQALVEAYVRGMEATSERAARLATRPRVYFEEWDDPTICGIEWVSELIEVAGGQDIFSDRARGAAARDRFVDAAEVVSAAPDIVLASWCGKPFDAEAFQSRSGFADLPAVKTGRVHEVAPEIILQPGPACLTDGLAALERYIQGDQARR
ncbi:MAG: cobalamin-binding protein [Myxococcota bacterium]|nr:cobalamin-binding protein [Myxococcota bacterium]